jgi:phenylpropionate dioxygenase-like ring-hydroxylating dioxygenase large terminal subunit
MADITLVKTTDAELPEDERRAMMRVLFGEYLDGMSEDDKTAWKKFWNRVKRLEAGELVKVSFKIERNGKFHRKFFAMLNVGFEAWDPGRTHKTHKGMPVQKNFEQFREDVTILAGFYEQTFDLQGRLVLKAKSISFANMEQAEFERVYSAVADVLLNHVLTNYTRADLDEVVEKVLRFL